MKTIKAQPFIVITILAAQIVYGVAAAPGDAPGDTPGVGPGDAPGVGAALSPDADVVAKLEALKPNQAVLLGKAAVVGEFNETARRYNLHKTGPRGRDFTIKMCWAADRKRVLFCGANHGVPHRLNDVWEFDLPSMTWVMLYAPDLPRGYGDLGKDTSDVVFKDGVLMTKRGGPAVIAHTWWGLTYDPRHKALLFMNTWVTNKKKAVEALGGDPAKLYEGPPLWAFYPHTRTWKPIKTDKPRPRPIFGGWLEFVPELKGTIWHANNWQMRATWLYNYEKNTWKNLEPNGGGKAFENNAPNPEQIGYYDPARKMLIAHRHYDTHHYHIKKNEWTKVIEGRKPEEKNEKSEDNHQKSDDKQPSAREKKDNSDAPITPYGHDARSVFYHDPTTGHGLLVQFQTNTLWSYNPDQLTWTKLNPQGDPMPTGRKRLAYVDPARNVVVVIEGVKVWAYRFKKK